MLCVKVISKHYLTQQCRNIADALAMPGVDGIEFNPPSVNIIAGPTDFS
jgi:hypothetical protein